MLNTFIVGAALLLSGNFMPTYKMTVEPKVVQVPASIELNQLTKEIERQLIENHAAPHWGLTIEKAWYEYQVTRQMQIIEIKTDLHFLITFEDGIIEIVIEDGMG